MRIRRVKKAKAEPAPDRLPAPVEEKPRQKQRQAAPGPLQSVLQNPNLGVQLLIVLLALVSENRQMDRRLETVGTTAEKIGSIAEVLTSTLGSVRAAAEGTKKIRKILE